MDNLVLFGKFWIDPGAVVASRVIMSDDNSSVDRVIVWLSSGISIELRDDSASAFMEQLFHRHGEEESV